MPHTLYMPNLNPKRNAMQSHVSGISRKEIAMIKSMSIKELIEDREFWLKIANTYHAINTAQEVKAYSSARYYEKELTKRGYKLN